MRERIFSGPINCIKQAAKDTRIVFSALGFTSEAKRLMGLGGKENFKQKKEELFHHH